ncbi:response regulator [Vibrio pectenicida]|uniref:Response regulator n=1 Tax=Vibrio pectenicida TaxID=62763 RepID=A0A7Y4ED58_9VIBR|nr:response regulator [Vibrio pectenicida]NOH71345.1 response regulator [Vibrio pectenicida]
MTKCRVLLVDDHPLMRRGVRQLLSFENEFEVVTEASNGSDAVSENYQVQPDLILLDLNMKGMSGLDTLNALRADGCDAIIIVMTVSDNVLDIDTMIKAGADGYLLKDTEPDEIIDLLKHSLTGNKVYSKQVALYLADNRSTYDVFEALTDRETQILKEVAKGYRNKQIANELFISEQTVKVHMKKLLKKLNVSSRTAATILYLERYGDLK